MKSHALTIESLRFGEHPDKTRIVVELDQASKYKAFVLSNPYRLVIDLPTYNWQAGQIKKPKNNIVSDIRTGALNRNTSRLVVDSNAPIAIRSAFLLPKAGSKPNRLVIDFTKISASQFDAEKKKRFGNYESEAPKFNLQTSDPSIPRSINITNKSKNTKNAPVTAQNYVTPTKKPTNAAITNVPKRSPPLKKPLIVIDAGHGGQDPGAIGADKTYEKKITLAAAKELKKQLEATGRYRVVLTRDHDKFIKLFNRIKIARNKNADMFISLHADSLSNASVRGASVYTLSNKASDAQTAKLARRENRADLIAGVDLRHEDKEVSDILIDLAMRDTMNQSKFFANVIVDTLKNNGIKTLERPHRYAGFAVLKAPDIPSVLIELGFMSNKQDISLLKNAGYRRKMSVALTESIDTYFQKVQKNNNQ